MLPEVFDNNVLPMATTATIGTSCEEHPLKQKSASNINYGFVNLRKKLVAAQARSPDIVIILHLALGLLTALWAQRRTVGCDDKAPRLNSG